MNTKLTPSRRREKTKPVPVIDDFDDCSVEEAKVEMITLTGFLRQIPHRWQITDRVRFAKEANKRCDALGLAFTTGVDAQLGAVRVFPIKLMRWTYDSIAAECHWPQIVDGVAVLEDKDATALRTAERTKKHLLAAAETAENPVIAQAMTTVLNWLESETKRIQEGGAPGSTVPLRAL